MLTQEESDAIRKRGPGRGSYLRSLLMSMKPGEIVFVDRNDWHVKGRTPSDMCGRIRFSTKGRRLFECQTALDGSGWIITCKK